MTELDPNTARYLDITRAHHTLERLGMPARMLNDYVNDVPVWDDDEDARPVAEALADLRDTAGAAATGITGPYDPDMWSHLYARKLMKRLELIADYAEDIAAGARSVIASLEDGLITAPRPWTAADITDGTMYRYLSEAIDGTASQAWGCIAALTEHRDAETINDAVYDRHMHLIDGQWSRRAFAHAPEREAELVADALGAWREHEHTANTALDEPVPFPQAAHAINNAATFERLGRYAAALTGPAWSATADTTDTYDNARAAADRLMIRIAQRYYTTDTDAAGVDRADAVELGDRIAAWRKRMFDDAVTFANAIDLAELDNDVERGAALADAYERLYRAADVAITTREMVDVWHAAGILPEDHAARVRISLALHFDADKPYLGVPIDDDGDNAAAARELRRLVDTTDMPSHAHAAAVYRGHAAALDELDMRGLAGDLDLVHVWAAVVSDADAGAITRRQVAALRELVNAKIAEWCDGSEAKAAAMAARLPDWDRIGDELGA